ncbi:hypothetical protein F1880_001827 [Penicillium rolfsii]|nr:hypothetical protein F1880_001827 [Penicillium rolfsii]
MQLKVYGGWWSFDSVNIEVSARIRWTEPDCPSPRKLLTPESTKKNPSFADPHENSRSWRKASVVATMVENPYFPEH